MKHTQFVNYAHRGTAAVTAEILRKFDVTGKVVVTSFLLEELEDFRACAPEYETGYLTDQITEELLDRMKSLGIGELCPEAHLTNKELVEQWHGQGFRVRAWGVYNTELMRQAYDAGCDGMTVNFPDKLTEYVDSSGK